MTARNGNRESCFAALFSFGPIGNFYRVGIRSPVMTGEW